MENTPLKGRTALITGGNRGIGWAIARAFAERGAVVGISGRNEETLEARAAELESLTPGAWWKRCDVRHEDEILELFAAARKRFERLDICVPNAGEATLASLSDTSLEGWNRDIETNLTGTFLCMREAVKWMSSTGGGKILPVVSQAGKVGFRLRAAYCASKWGTLGLIESSRHEARDHGIMITALCPASVATDFQSGNPMGMDWMLAAEDVADAAVYAASVSSRVELPEILIRCRNKPRSRNP